MKRFATMLLALVLVSGLSFPMSALAVETTGLEAGQPARTQAGGHEWHVAVNGSDKAAGTLKAPFATIGHAISVMQGGDTVYVHGGTYREEIANVPSGTADRPSRICAYNDEKVWLTGSELVSGWKQAEANGNIWVADMDWDLHDVTEFSVLGPGPGDPWTAQHTYYDNLVFVGGNPAPEGRWPNATVDEFLDRSHYAVADGADANRIRDAQLAELPEGVDFTGADAWVAAGGGYLSITAHVTRHAADENRLYIKPNSSSGSYTYTPASGNYYYVTKSLATLDAANEWYKDVEAKKLYLYEPKGVDPNKLAVEVQKRTHVVRIGYGEDAKGNVTYEDASYIDICGINAKLGAIAFSPKSSHCTFEQAVVDCPDHKVSTNTYGLGAGVLLEGSDNLLTRCEIMHAYGAAVQLRDSHNKVVNNHIHDTNYEHGQTDAAIRISGREQLVSHNTIHHVMRGAVGGTFEASEICYNDMYDCMRVSRDGGIVYFNWHDYGNSELHHNLMHDTLDFPFDHIQVGLYLDSFTNSLVVYRNVVYGVQKYEEGNSDVNNNGRHLTYQLDPNSLNNVFVNNTFVNYRPTHLNFYPNQDCSGTVFVNNIYQSMSWIDGPTYYPWWWHNKWDRAANKLVRTDRDILAEMGMLFDRDHNLEGGFANNIWPPIENPGWADPAKGDYTLVDRPAANSPVIDKGVEVAGITDGYASAAPDLGAYEVGQAWDAGCDLGRDIEDTFALNEEIPYRNLMSNPGFEVQDPDRPAGISYVDFSDWKESGTPQRVGRMSSWAHWGWIVKQGTACAVLDSADDVLTQHVSGLKPNTAYRVGGYAFVAGDFLRRNSLTGAKTSNLVEVSDSKLATLRNGDTALPLDGLGELEFGDVDFGAGRDRLIVGLKSPKAYEGDRQQVISVALGDSGNVVGSYTMTKDLSTAETGWRWVTIDLGGTYAGKQDVHILLQGAYPVTGLAGIIPDCSISDETLSITASASDAAQPGTVTVSSWYKPFEGSHYAQHSTVVKTGKSGELDVTVSKQGGDLVGYADEIFLAELPGGANFGETSSCTHVFKAGTCDLKWKRGADGAVESVTATCDRCGEKVEVETSSDDFKVVKASIADASVSGLGAKIYSGKAIEPAPVVKIGSAKLKSGTDYSVSYKNNIKAGTATVKLTGKGNFFGSQSVTFKINPVSVTSASVSVSGLGARVYTGKAIKPLPTVKWGKVTLKSGTDYKVSYKNNTKVGAATVTVAGAGNYSGTKSATFKITKAANPLTVKVHAASVSLSKVKRANQVIAAKRVFTVSKAKGAVSYKRLSGNKKIAVSSAGKVTVKKGLKKGTYKVQVKVTAKGDANYKPGSKTVTAKISVR